MNKRSMSKSGWFDAVIGVWLVVSPWVLEYAEGAAMRAHVLYGGVSIALAALTIIVPLHRYAWSRLAFAIGVWLVVSPWALGYAGDGWAAINGALTGGIIASVALDALSGATTGP